MDGIDRRWGASGLVSIFCQSRRRRSRHGAQRGTVCFKQALFVATALSLRSAYRRSARLLFAALVSLLALAPSTFAQTSVGDSVPATAASQSQQTMRDWHARMQRVPLPKEGCFASSFPSAEWQEVPCASPPAKPVPFPPGRNIHLGMAGGGGTSDASAKVTGEISEAIGSFDSVTGVTSESGANGANASAATRTEGFSG